MEGEEKRREAGGWLSISLSTFCPVQFTRERRHSFCSRAKRHTCLLPPFLAFQVFF